MIMAKNVFCFTSLNANYPLLTYSHRWSLLNFAMFPRVEREPTLPEKCPHLEFFWSVFSRYSVEMRENKNQENSEY